MPSVTTYTLVPDGVHAKCHPLPVIWLAGGHSRPISPSRVVFPSGTLYWTSRDATMEVEDMCCMLLAVAMRILRDLIYLSRGRGFRVSSVDI